MIQAHVRFPYVGPTNDPTETFRREPPEVASASGGHLTPETTPNPLVEAPPSQTERVRPVEPGPRVARDPRAPRRRRPTVRRVRRTLRHIDPVSVFKLSLFYYACFLVVWLLFVAMLYAVVSSMGFFDLIESVGEGFALGWDVNINLFFVERWAFVIGLFLVVLGSLLNLFLAFLYNLVSDFVGGVEMTFVDRDF